MAQFDYDKVLGSLMVPEVVSALASIREQRGRRDLFETLQPQTLSTLCEVAKIQSTGASNRIENISTTGQRLRELVRQTIEPRTRDEREIAGYRYVLNLIHGHHDDIPVTPGVILQLHRDLYRYLDVSFAGHWKDADNRIAERLPTGELVTLFQPTSALATPVAIDQICSAYQQQIKSGVYDPLLISLVFVFDFVSIHPFNDGNGRMSRLLTLLLLYRNGYDVGKYVSIEAEIERTKETYYEALHASSAGWDHGENSYIPFVTYVLGVVLACYQELDRHIAIATSSRSNETMVRDYFDGLIGSASKQDILEARPSLSKKTLERILQKLQREGFIEKVGAARATRYRRVQG